MTLSIKTFLGLTVEVEKRKRRKGREKSKRKGKFRERSSKKGKDQESFQQGGRTPISVLILQTYDKL